MTTEYVIATGLGTIRATVDDANKVTDSTGGMLTGLTLKQVRKMIVDHKWSIERVGEEEAKEEEAEHPKKKGGR